MTEKSIYNLTDAERMEITHALILYFTDDRKLPTFGLTSREPFSKYPSRVISNVIQSMRNAGLIEQSGRSRDSAYSLTDAGVAVKRSYDLE